MRCTHTGPRLRVQPSHGPHWTDTWVLGGAFAVSGLSGVLPRFAANHQRRSTLSSSGIDKVVSRRETALLSDDATSHPIRLMCTGSFFAQRICPKGQTYRSARGFEGPKLAQHLHLNHMSSGTHRLRSAAERGSKPCAGMVCNPLMYRMQLTTSPTAELRHVVTSAICRGLVCPFFEREVPTGAADSGRTLYERQ